MRIIVTGLIGQYAFGGVIWDYIQYALGFRALGHDVWYLEDTGAWAYDPVRMEPSADCSINVARLSRIMSDFDMGDRWIYRNGADGKTYGVSNPAEVEKILFSADVLANVSGACWLRPETARIPLKLFLDGDPMFTQVGMLDCAKPQTADRIAAHERHYSFGLNIGHPGCRVPTSGITWRPTVQPVALDQWMPTTTPDGAWTTVMNWASYPPKEFDGESYGQKDIEFTRFQSLPKQTTERFVLAMGQGVGSNRPTRQLEENGWTILEPDEHIPDHNAYRRFITASKGEWSIAKHGYVHSRSGWFSCRTACYLAAGKPAVVQDTGWSDRLPASEGVIAFNTLEEARKGITAVSADYACHSRAAREFAAKHFSADKVCAELLED